MDFNNLFQIFRFFLVPPHISLAEIETKEHKIDGKILLETIIPIENINNYALSLNLSISLNFPSANSEFEKDKMILLPKGKRYKRLHFNLPGFKKIPTFELKFEVFTTLSLVRREILQKYRYIPEIQTWSVEDTYNRIRMKNFFGCFKHNTSLKHNNFDLG